MVLLHLLAERESYGYEVAQRLQSAGFADVLEGTVYPALTRLEREERLVWTLDQRLYDLPRASRIAKRREVRANLLEAAADQGARQALRRIGSSSALAREYLGAEFGDRPHHSWIAAAYFAALVPLLL